MKKFAALIVFACLGFACVVNMPQNEQTEKEPLPLRLHPWDSRYLEFRHKPIILITSAEHYGAVLNVDFDFERYLETLHQDGMNYTRVFTGSYVERASSFGIEKNTLAPAKGKLIAPWARSNRTGYINGGNKFDLDHWDPRYFTRLKNFVRKAGELEIIVEVTFFSSIYQDSHWQYSPFNPRNNINIKDDIDWKNVNTLDNGSILDYQEKLVREIVRELNEFDNVFFEIQNEPWADRSVTKAAINPFLPEWDKNWVNRVDLADQASLDWQKRIVDFIVDEELNLPWKHLIAQNYCNFKYPLKDVDERVSILNFHYAYPEAVSMNYWYRKVMSFDESGFSGSEDDAYRRQAWRFILAGGGIFNHLDYSFYPGAEDGTGQNKAPGGGSPELRRQLKVLKDFIHDFDFVRMGPGSDIVRLSPGCVTRVLGNRSREFAIYVEGESACNLDLNIWQGLYQADWIDTRTGDIVKEERVEHWDRSLTLTAPEFDGDIALRIQRIND